MFAETGGHPWGWSGGSLEKPLPLRPLTPPAPQEWVERLCLESGCHVHYTGGGRTNCVV